MTTLRRWEFSNRPTDRALRDLSNALGRTPQFGAHRIVAVDTVIVDSDYLILVDTTAADVTVVCPDGLRNLDRQWVVKHYVGGNDVIVDGFGGQLIYAMGAGATTLTWNSVGTAYRFCAIATDPSTGALAVI